MLHCRVKGWRRCIHDTALRHILSVAGRLICLVPIARGLPHVGFDPPLNRGVGLSMRHRSRLSALAAHELFDQVDRQRKDNG
jgi:hypothetical protein